MTAALMLGLALAGAGPADPKALVEALVAPSFAARQAASAGLARLDRAATPALTAALADPRPEVRARAAALLVALKLRGDSAGYRAPRSVACDYSEVPLVEALADLGRRAGVKLRLTDDFPDPRRPVTAHLSARPAWEAVEAFRAAAGLGEQSPTPAPDPSRIVSNWAGGPVAVQPTPARPAAEWDAIAFGPAPTPSGAADRSGVLRVRALPPGDPAHKIDRDAGTVTLALDVAFPIRMGAVDDIRVVLTRATDSRGRPVPQAFPPAPDAEGDDDDGVLRVLRVGNAGGWNGNFRFAGAVDGSTRPNPRSHALELLAGNATRLSRLEGVVAATVIGPDRVVLAVPDLAVAVGKTLHADDGSAVEILAVDPAPGGAMVRLRWVGNQAALVPFRAAFPGGVLVPFDLADNLGTRLRFRTATGQPVPVPTFSQVESVAGSEGTITLTFGPGAPPASLSVTGSCPVAVELPFVLTDVVLP